MLTYCYNITRNHLIYGVNVLTTRYIDNEQCI